MRQGQIFDYIYHIETEAVTHFVFKTGEHMCVLRIWSKIIA